MIRNYFLTAWRSMRSNLAHTVINVAGLALGLSGTLFIVLWISNEISFDRFHEKSATLYRVMTNYTPTGDAVSTHEEVPSIIGTNISQQLPQVESLTRVITIERWPGKLCFKHLKNSTEECFYRQGLFADDNFFSTFTYPIIRGDNNAFSLSTNIAISKSMAEELFPGTVAIGKSIFIDNWIEVTVSAVFEDVPSNSSQQFDFVLPFPVYRKLTGFRNDAQWETFSLEVYLKTNAALDTAAFRRQINAPAIVPQQVAEAGMSFFVQPYEDRRLYNRFENGKAAGGRIVYVKIFGLIGAAVLLIACINFINLATARAIARGKEIGVRKVNGARRHNLIVQFLGESFLSVLLALLLATGLVQFALPAFNYLTGEELVFDLFTFPVPLFLIAALIIVTLISGIYPAFIMSGYNPVTALKNKIDPSGSAAALRKTLTVLQMTASGVLIIFTAVLFLQLSMIMTRDLGYDRNNIIRIEPTHRLLTKFDAFREALLKDPVFVNASAATGDLLNISFVSDQVSWPGKDRQQQVPFRMLACSNDFLETFGIPVVQGRGFDPDQGTQRHQLILSREAVERMDLAEPIGSTINFFGKEAEVIGVVNDIHSRSLHHDIEPTIFQLAENTRLTAIYVKYSGGTQEAFEKLKATYNAFEPDYSMIYWFFDESFDKQYKGETVTGRLAAVFTILAIGISLLGILGLATYNVLKRMREIGVRKVFGASVAQIFAMLSMDFAKLALVSSVLAWPLGAYAANEWLSDFAFRISVPWYIYVFSTLIVLLLTLVTIGSQTLKAAFTNPAHILKNE